MIKSLTMALGGLTALAVAGLATPSGQAMLGTHQASPAVPVSVISDPGPVGPTNVTVPAATPVPTAPRVAAPAPVVSERHVSAPAAQVARPVYRPTARGVYRPVASAPAAVSRAVPAPAGLPIGGAGGIGSIMQFLPSMLQQGAPAPSQYGYGYGLAPAPQAAPVPVSSGGNQGIPGDGPEHH
jgi:hypothetical protein